MSSPKKPRGYPASLYAAVHTGTPGDLLFYAQACGDASRILELGCGDGRVLEHLAAVPQRTCVGLELDPGLLALARRRIDASAPAGAVELVHGDMRSFHLDAAFDRVLLPHGSLYCLLEPEDVTACFDRVRAHLAPGGELWLDAYGADAFHTHNDPDEMEEDALTFVTEVDVEDRRFRVSERSAWDRARQTIDATYLYEPNDGGATIEGHLPQRYMLAEQVLEAVLAAQLEPIALFGAFDASPYDPDDAELLIVGAKRPVTE